jgi:Dullard-like phosphatase family protein
LKAQVEVAMKSVDAAPEMKQQQQQQQQLLITQPQQARGFMGFINRVFCACFGRDVAPPKSSKEAAAVVAVPMATQEMNLDGKRDYPPIPPSLVPASAYPTVSGHSPAAPVHGIKYLLPPLKPEQLDEPKKCLVLDLDETLVHSSFKPIPNPDFIVPVEIEGQVHNVYVLKRPHVDGFLKQVAQWYEVVLFTASLSKYADPVTDHLDPDHSLIQYRLFRQHCLLHRGSYIKDLGQLGRNLKNVIIVDNSPQSYLFHPWNAVGVQTWFDDPHDAELLVLGEMLAGLKGVSDVTRVLRLDVQEEEEEEDDLIEVLGDMESLNRSGNK